MVIALVVLLFMSLIAVGVIAVWRKSEKGKTPKSLWLIPIIIAALILLFDVFTIIPAGYRGVVLVFGKVEGTYGEGLNLKIPFISEVIQMSVKTQLFEHKKATAASKDIQDVITDLAINYKLDPNKVGEIYRTVGLDYIAKIADPVVQEILKEVTARYVAEDTILKRAQLKGEIESILSDRLKPRGVIIEGVNITNFAFSAEFTKAIEAKQVAAQKVLEAENKLREIEVVARQAEQQAKGEAAAAIARAEGQVKAMQMLSESLTDSYLRYLYIDKLAKDAKIIIVPEGMPFTVQP